MSEFFNSDIIKDELMKINQLQEEVYKHAFTFETMSRDDQLDHIEDLTELLDMQRVMSVSYTHLTLPTICSV